MDKFEILFGSNPVLQVLVPFITVALPMLFLFAYATFGFMVGSLEIKGARSGRALFDRAAKQLATAGLVLGWTLLIGSRVWLFVQSEGYVPQSFLAVVVELSWGVFGFAVIASSIHFAVWKPLANHKIGHAFLAYFSGINGLFALFALMGAIRLMAAAELPNAAQLSLNDIYNFSQVPSPQIAGLALILPLGLAVPPLAAICWIFVRRQKEDYGRDYYNALVKWCASWGLVFWPLVTLVLAGTAWMDIRPLLGAATPVAPMALVEPTVRVLLPLVICLVLWLTKRAELPMRMKPYLIVCFFLALGASHYLYTCVTSFVF